MKIAPTDPYLYIEAYIWKQQNSQWMENTMYKKNAIPKEELQHRVLTKKKVSGCNRISHIKILEHRLRGDPDSKKIWLPSSYSNVWHAVIRYSLTFRLTYTVTTFALNNHSTSYIRVDTHCCPLCKEPIDYIALMNAFFENMPMIYRFIKSHIDK